MARSRNGAVAKQLRTVFHLGTTRELTDGQLLERFATGGEIAELAFATLLERHGPMVLRVCRGILAESHDSQDAFQATFLVLVKKARGLWVRDSLGPWLHQVACRTSLCARQAIIHRHRHEQCAAGLRHEAQFEVHDDLAGVLHEEIERLPERFRSPLILCDLEGRTHEQAARHLGWPVGTVKSRQARGRQRLRDRLRRRGLTPEPSILTAALRHDGMSAVVPPALVNSTIQSAIQLVALRVFMPSSIASLAQGVLNSMSFTRWLKVASVLLFLGAATSGVGLLAEKSSQDGPPQPTAPILAARASDAPTYSVKPGKLILSVVERGSLELARREDAYCLVEGQTTIIQIKPEGSAVKKGDVVCRLDSTSFKDQVINQLITVKSAETNYENAKLAREIAEVAITEYVDGIYKHERGTLQDAITDAQSAIQKADSQLERTRTARKRVQDILATKGAATTPSDIVAELDIEDRLDSAELTRLRGRTALEQAKSKQDLLEKITRPRIMRELKDEVERKRSSELVKKANWDLEQSKAKKLERQIAACNIKAPSDGVLVYANDPSRAFGSNRPQIEKGASVRERQRILSVFDPNGPMQVNTKVHESQVDKLARRSRMKARIRVDAFLSEVLNGTVVDVAPVPDSTNFFNSGIKVYTTKVRIDDSLSGLKPGMTAVVEILISESDNVLTVPVEAIVRYDDKDRVAVKKSDGGFEWREVALGQSNDRFVEIKHGIKSGEIVVVKPLTLLSEEQKRMMKSSPTAPAAKPNGP